MKIPFSPPFIDDDVKREVMEVLESGWITSGPKVKLLEQMMCGLTHTEHCLCCNSATSALMLALHWFGVSRGDEVIIPAYTYAATALSVMHLGATPVMVDAGEDFNINVTAIRSKITSRTKAIIPVDIAGWPCNYRGLFELVRDPAIAALFHPSSESQRQLGRILILADSAHGIGAEHDHQPLGKCADLTVFSFHAVKNVTTAEGGAISISLPEPFSNEHVWKTLKLWSLNGQTKDALAKSKAGDWKYDIVYPGFKMNMPDILAAIAIAQLRKYESVLLPERKKINGAYRDAFSNYSWAQLPPSEDDYRSSSCHLYALRIHGISEEQRNRIIQHVALHDVSVNVHFQPLPLLTVFRDRGYSIEDYPVAYDNFAREISLPIWHGLTSDQIVYIVNAVKEGYEMVVSDEAFV